MGVFSRAVLLLGSGAALGSCHTEALADSASLVQKSLVQESSHAGKAKTASFAEVMQLADEMKEAKKHLHRHGGADGLAAMLGSAGGKNHGAAGALMKAALGAAGGQQHGGAAGALMNAALGAMGGHAQGGAAGNLLSAALGAMGGSKQGGAAANLMNVALGAMGGHAPGGAGGNLMSAALGAMGGKNPGLSPEMLSTGVSFVEGMMHAPRTEGHASLRRWRPHRSSRR